MILRHAVSICGRAAGRLVAAALIVLGVAASAAAQAAPVALPNPRKAQPERPSVATHAFTVAPGHVELETGFQRQKQGTLADRLAIPIKVKIGLNERIQLHIAPGVQRDTDSGYAESGLTDLVLGLKWRLTDDVPVLGGLALQTEVSLPTGSEASGRGTGVAAVNLAALSSHSIGPVAIDVNAWYTRRGGDGTIAPSNSTLWAVATVFPVPSSLGWVVEMFGLPGTAGPTGEPPVVGFLSGPFPGRHGWLATRILDFPANRPFS